MSNRATARVAESKAAVALNGEDAESRADAPAPTPRPTPVPRPTPASSSFQVVRDNKRGRGAGGARGGRGLDGTRGASGARGAGGTRGKRKPKARTAGKKAKDSGYMSKRPGQRPGKGTAQTAGKTTAGKGANAGEQERPGLDNVEVGERPGMTFDRPGIMAIIVRLIAWSTALFRIASWLLLTRRRLHRRGYRIRRVIQSLGGPAIVLVRQFAMRLELMPLDVAAELARLTDFSVPMPLDKAFEEYKRYTGRDIEDDFEIFDPEPILSTTLDNVYQAVLRTGDKVAVRIMKPGAAHRIHSERVALDILTRTLALVMPSYKDRLRALRDELPYIESEILDFVKLARTHELLEKEIHRWRVGKKFHVVNIYVDYCSKNVIVSEFIEGFWLHEVLWAQDSGDEDALALLAESNIVPEKCAARVFEFGLWSMLENVFALAAPRASQFAVMPNNELVVIQIGTVTTFGRYQKRVYVRIYERILRRDFEGIAELLIESLFPLPLIDVYAFTKSVEKAIVLQLIGIENKDAPSHVRSGIGLWLAFLREAQKFGVVVPLELSRMIQSMCTFCEVAFRLDPKMKFRRQLRRYLTRALRRQARDVERAFLRPNKRGGSRFTSRPQEVSETIERGLRFVESSFEMVPIAYLASSKKVAFSLAQILGMFFFTAKVTAAWIAVVVSLRLVEGAEVNFFSELWQIVTSPAYLGFAAVMMLILARRIQFRLDDLDN